MPTTARRATVPARQARVLRQASRARRHSHRPAAMQRMLRLPRRRPGPVEPDRTSPALSPGHQPAPAPRQRAPVVRQGHRIPTPRPDPRARRHPDRRPSRSRRCPAGVVPSCSATAAAVIPSGTLPDPRTAGTLALRWGDQLDVRPVRRGIAGQLDDSKVAAYVAKYSSKGTEDCGGIPRRIRSAADLDDYHVTPAPPENDHHLLAARPARRVRQPAARKVGPPARLLRMVLHPIPPLLRHPRITPAGTPRHPHPPARTPRPARHHHQRLALRRPGRSIAARAFLFLYQGRLTAASAGAPSVPVP